ncbi:hypothetical protein BDV36DRAFT_171939 [Aspergillus pseudocaelatus]|uniref:Uncharacterized protein n=1 Tax=Aspergillus pseudocaelatus TaxID=1825620 RepID=A0ABQ6WKZ3_9EURO|nr:hypothetical protein BDV36DRAFT_171939 [Aspergillus pseudocaelatus]
MYPVQRPVIQIWPSCYIIIVVISSLVPCRTRDESQEDEPISGCPHSPFGVIQKPLSSLHHPLLTLGPFPQSTDPLLQYCTIREILSTTARLSAWVFLQFLAAISLFPTIALNPLRLLLCPLG